MLSPVRYRPARVNITIGFCSFCADAVWLLICGRFSVRIFVFVKLRGVCFVEVCNH